MGCPCDQVDEVRARRGHSRDRQSVCGWELGAGTVRGSSTDGLASSARRWTRKPTNPDSSRAPPTRVGAGLGGSDARPAIPRRLEFLGLTNKRSRARPLISWGASSPTAKREGSDRSTSIFRCTRGFARAWRASTCGCAATRPIAVRARRCERVRVARADSRRIGPRQRRSRTPIAATHDARRSAIRVQPAPHGPSFSGGFSR